jgi:hypothetical protein
MSSVSLRCAQCQLVNFGDAAGCRRCGAVLEVPGTAIEPIATSSARRVARRLLWLAAVTLTIVFAWSRSLLLTSSPIDETQRQIVMQAIARIEQAGFAREVLVLRHVANYRATDNWWNRHLGHSDAYAATNFPLGVMTLYRPFFTIAVDDTERAAVLLHEAQHMWGAGEEQALAAVWRQKERLGWTVEQYSRTRVWRNTREWTVSAVPALFHCGSNHSSDCVP